MIQALLTIDDIASKNTPAIVDYLKEKGIQALLFAWGQNVERNWDEAVYALKRGMIVGNHSYSHPAFSSLSFEAGVAEIERCEALLAELYRSAGVERRYRPFRFPYGDKGGASKAAFQAYLAEKGFNKVKDTGIPYPWWRESGLDRDIDTFWTYDFAEYNLRPGSDFTEADIWRRMRDAYPGSGAPLLAEGGRHILLLHAHDETEAMLPGYYRLFIDHLLEKGVTFIKPEFFERER